MFLQSCSPSGCISVGNDGDPKRNACFMCAKLLTKVSKHFNQCHSDEADVARLLAQPVGSKDRRPGEICNPADYGPCPHCLGYFVRSDLWKLKAWVLRTLRFESKMLQDAYQTKANAVLCVINGMKQDAITLTLGESLSIKCIGMDSQKRKHYVSQKMRESARLLILTHCR